MKIQFLLASVMLAMLAGVGTAKADLCDAALQMHQTIMTKNNAMSREINEELKKLGSGIARVEGECELGKLEIEHREIWVRLVKEDERVCSKKILKKRLNCDSACATQMLGWAKDANKKTCGEDLEKAKKEAAEWAAIKLERAKKEAEKKEADERAAKNN